MIISPIEFVSQKKHGKRSEYSCGVACLMMLLKYNNTSYHTTFKKLGDFLEVDKRAIDKSVLIDYNVLRQYGCGSKGAYQENIIAYLRKVQINFEASYYTDDTSIKRNRLSTIIAKIKNNIPLMVEVGKPWEPDGHWLILNGYTLSELYFLNPYHTIKPKTTKSKECFLKAWDGISLNLV